MAHILIVCTANICRSPVGEAILRDRLQKHGLSHWITSSAGAWAVENQEASQFSIDVCETAGLDISAHRSRQVDAELLERADLVLCMETRHVVGLQAEFPGYAHKIYLLSEMVAKRPYSLPDPYGQPFAQYQQMADDLTQLIDKGLNQIIELARENERQQH